MKDLEILVGFSLRNTVRFLLVVPSWVNFLVDKETHGGKIQFDLLIFGILSSARV